MDQPFRIWRWLICYQVSDFDLTSLPDQYFDIFFSFGVCVTILLSKLALSWSSSS